MSPILNLILFFVIVFIIGLILSIPLIWWFTAPADKTRPDKRRKFDLPIGILLFIAPFGYLISKWIREEGIEVLLEAWRISLLITAAAVLSFIIVMAKKAKNHKQAQNAPEGNSQGHLFLFCFDVMIHHNNEK